MEAGADSQIWGRRGALALAILVVAAIAFFVIKGFGGSSSKKGEPQAVDASKLSDLASGAGHPVYWAGPDPSATYEWTELDNGRIFVRYLTGGAQPGDQRPLFLTVGTYPVGNGIHALRVAQQSVPGDRLVKVPGGATALVNKNGRSTFLAYPNSAYEIEVFDPNPAKALRLVTSGKIKPIP